MKLFKDGERAAAEAIAALNYTNPFMPERVNLEKTILGAEHLEQGAVWNVHSKSGGSKCNIEGISKRAEQLALELNLRLRNKQVKADKQEFQIYEDVVVYHIFEQYREKMTTPIYNGKGNVDFSFYADFEAELISLLQVPGYSYSSRYDVARTFEIFYQVHRAFYYIFDFIIGSSLPVAKLRAAIWQSIFTHDIHRYNRSLYKKMHNITTLITGESGTGKELVALALAMSQYIQFDPTRKKFKEDFRELFHPLHLSAMPHTLIESELFGHKKGAYTGALQDRIGWMELCSEFGTVFLDEIGEVNEEIQVKLLRLLQSRKFQRLGETDDRVFKGKIIAATNRNLAEFIQQGRFRSDLYYRLCSDIVETPTLREQLDGSNDGLANLVHFLSVRIVGRSEADDLAEEALIWIKQNLGTEYAWPGNVRELEQCMRNILIRGYYSPSQTLQWQGGDSLMRELADCALTADELLNLYCAKVYQKTGSYQQSAQLLELDRRTVKKRIDSVLQ
jgi:Sigma-54 interaction domain